MFYLMFLGVLLFKNDEQTVDNPFFDDSLSIHTYMYIITQSVLNKNI